MKKIYLIVAGLLLTASVLAQAPQKMSYQAVIRNSSNLLVTSTPVGMKVSVLQGSATGTVAYAETQTPSTNANGLVSLEIGSGTPETGTFAGINWANGPYFIKTETDPTGGTAYSITGTNELMSVPYALFSVNGTPGATGAQGPIGLTGSTGASGLAGIMTQAQRDALTATAGFVVYNTTTNKPNYYNGTEWMNYDGITAEILTIGMSYRGGKIAYILVSGDPGFDADRPHGLIATVADLSSSIMWAGASSITGATLTSIGSGNANTNTIVANRGAEANAAKLCSDLVEGGYSDWYLPSKDELQKLYINRAAIGGFNSGVYYWTSTEYGANTAFAFYYYGGAYSNPKTSTGPVRGVRAF